MNMRKKTHYSGQRSNNNNNKRRFVRKPGGGGGGGGSNRYGSGGGEDLDAVNPRMRKQAQANREKYLAMAKDALSSGDRVESEYYLQHADHYLRILNAIDAQFAPRQHQPQQEREGADCDGQDVAEATAGMPEAPSVEVLPEEEEAEAFGPNDGAQLASVLPAPRMPRAAKLAE